MPTIKISQAHNKPLAQVREIADELAEKLSQSYSVTSKWESDNKASFERKGLTGTMVISDSDVHINLELGFMLAGFKGAIQTKVEDQLKEKLA